MDKRNRVDCDQLVSLSPVSGFSGWFMRYILLLPVVVMASYYIGRGMGDCLQLLYIVGGLYSLRNMDFSEHKTVLWLFGVLLLLFSISVFYPDFSLRSLKYWALCALSGLVIVFTVGTASKNTDKINYYLLAWVPVALLFGLAVELGYFYFWLAEFHPATQVNGMVLAALAPLVLLSTKEPRKLQWLLHLLFFVAAALLLILADSRTEILMLIVSYGLFFTLYYRKIFALILILPSAILVTVVADSYLYDATILTFSGDWYHWLDRLSSTRLSIWSEALSHPPDHYFIGVGPSRAMEFLNGVNYVKHLHNLLVEIWFETGVLGLIAYLSLLYALLSGMPLAYRSLAGVERWVYSVFLAAGAAAFIGAMLDKGYLHPLTRYYMLFCFTVLYLQHWKCSRDQAK